jgi:Fur family zinc uptake transcriptional regulator
MTHSQHSHNHDICLHQALEMAETACKQRAVRLTPVRKAVLEIIWQDHTPIGAYTILESLKNAGLAKAPPQVYRALNFLMEQGFIHKINSLNAYIGCPNVKTDHDHSHSGTFFICTACHTVAEIEGTALADNIAQQAAQIGFRTTPSILEINGLCASCQNTHP